MIHWLLASSADSLLAASKNRNMADPDFKNLKHLQNLGHFFLTEPGKSYYIQTCSLAAPELPKGNKNLSRQQKIPCKTY